MYKGDAQVGKMMKSVVAPVLPQLQASGITPDKFLGGMTQAYMQLTNQNIPEGQRAHFGVQMLKQFGVDLSKFEIVGADGQPAQRSSLPSEAEQGLRAEIAALQSRLSDRDRREAQTTYQTLSKEIEKFAADPANEFFSEVVDDIVTLVKGSEGRLGLKDAYEKAVRANPATFAKLQAKLEQATAEKLKAEAAQRAEAARKATGANVNSRGHSGAQNSAPTGSWEDTMRATLNKIHGRA